MFLIQLLVAGNETTRHAVSGGIAALAEHPEQWERLRADRGLVPTAVDEVLRWTTPVISFLRTATVDTVLGGTEVAAGDPLLLLYASANRDEAAFGPDAGRFDVGRSPNPHLAFGFGTHFCLGAALARVELAVVLEGLLDRFDTVDTRRPGRAHRFVGDRRAAAGAGVLRPELAQLAVHPAPEVGDHGVEGLGLLLERLVGLVGEHHQLGAGDGVGHLAVERGPGDAVLAAGDHERRDVDRAEAVQGVVAAPTRRAGAGSPPAPGGARRPAPPR